MSLLLFIIWLILTVVWSGWVLHCIYERYGPTAADSSATQATVFILMASFVGILLHQIFQEIK